MEVNCCCSVVRFAVTTPTSRRRKKARPTTMRRVLVSAFTSRTASGSSRHAFLTQPTPPPPRVHQSPSPLRQFVVAKSSKASKVGRFPPTPSTDHHPLTLQPSTTTTVVEVEGGITGGGGGGGNGGNGGGDGAGATKEGRRTNGDEVGRLCAEWRAGAGKPGATVMREVQAMLNPTTSGGSGGEDDTNSSAETVVVPVADEERTTATNEGGWRLLLTHKNENLYNAFALEIAALSPSSRGLATGLFAVPRPLHPSVLARMVGLRAVVDPLCVGATAAELVEAAGVGSLSRSQH